ncbi:MAG: SixA phosphatase family protein [Rickettsiales bacterium]
MQSSANSIVTQRRLILIRHAKAVEEDVAGDHHRALSERGQGDARALGVWLREQKLVPDLALCSTANRTRQTLAAITQNVATILSDKLYLASAGEMIAQIQATDDAVNTLMLVGHNPGAHSILAALVGEYADEADADRLLLKFPTSACAVMSLNTASWRDVEPEAARLELLRY